MNAPRFPTYPDDVMREIERNPLVKQARGLCDNIKSLQTQLQGQTQSSDQSDDDTLVVQFARTA